MKEMTMHLSNQNYKSWLNLILFFFQVPPFVRADSPKIKLEKWQTFQQPWLSVVRDRSMNPVIIKMEHFAIIVNNFKPFAIVAMSSILNVVGLLNPPLHCNKFAAKAVGWFKPKRMVIHTLGECIWTN